MTLPEGINPDGTKAIFGTLFTDARHVRGDLKLVRKAMREDWVRAEDRDALMERLGVLFDVIEKAGVMNANARAFFALVRTYLLANRLNADMVFGIERELLRGQLTSKVRGRLPNFRRADAPLTRELANAIRRQLCEDMDRKDAERRGTT